MDWYDAMIIAGGLAICAGGWLIHPSLGLGILGGFLIWFGRELDPGRKVK